MARSKGQLVVVALVIGAFVLATSATCGWPLNFDSKPADPADVDAVFEAKLQERGWESYLNAEGGVVIADTSGCTITMEWFDDVNGYRITRLQPKADASRAVTIGEKHELGTLNIRKEVVLDVFRLRNNELPCR